MNSGSELAIRYETDAHRKPRLLQSQLEQVIVQKGAFRDISEKSLGDDGADRPESIGASSATPSDGAENSDDEDPKTRQEHLWKQRNGMLQKLSYAQNEVLSALDFISLLLSGQSRQAQSSMSPALTAVVPPGTLGSKVMGNSSISATTQARLSKASDGWKCKNFAAAAEKLSSATSRLNVETTRQGRYWEQISRLKDQGWTISRFPSDGRSIGAHIGSAESASQFRNRGFVILQQNAHGELELDARVATRRIEPLSFVIRRNNIPTGVFKATLETDHVQIEAKLMRARDALFEEELFYEINREARVIANHGVSTRANSVDVKIDHLLSLQITTANVPIPTGSSPEDDKLAQYFGLCARLLLFSEHARLHERRCQPPVVMSSSSSSSTAPELTILRRLIANVRHQVHLATFSRLCLTYATVFERAGVRIDVDVQSHSQTQSAPLRDIISDKPGSMINLNLASGKHLTLSLATVLGPPIYGTEFTRSATEYSFATTKRCTFRDQSEAQAALLHALNFELLNEVIDTAGKSTASKLTWSLTRHSSGELSINQGSRSIARVTAQLEPGRLSFSVTDAPKRKSIGRRIYIWDESGCSLRTSSGTTSPASKTLTGVIAEVIDTISEEAIS